MTHYEVKSVSKINFICDINTAFYSSVELWPYYSNVGDLYVAPTISVFIYVASYVILKMERNQSKTKNTHLKPWQFYGINIL
jgi:hypothetical protein